LSAPTAKPAADAAGAASPSVTSSVYVTNVSAVFDTPTIA
jgi:hypothetical protein